MRKIEIKYWVNMFLVFMCVLTIYDIISVFPYDLYAIVMGQFISVPLGIICIVVSMVIQKTEVKKEKWKTYISAAGIILGLITATLSIVLFKIGMVLG